MPILFRRRSGGADEEKPPARLVAELAGAPYVGEPEIVIDPRTLTVYSKLLEDLEFMYILVMNAEELARLRLRVKRDPRQAIRSLAREVAVRLGDAREPYYISASRGGEWVRMIIGGSKLVALAVEGDTNILTGLEALEALSGRNLEAEAVVARIKLPVGE